MFDNEGIHKKEVNLLGKKLWWVVLINPPYLP